MATLADSPTPSNSEAPEPAQAAKAGRWQGYLWPAIYLVVALAIQWKGQAYSNDLGGDPDEAAHAVTSLMVRDYLLQAPGQHPLRFAEDYYERFPKVALGHYPPGFYALAGAWLAPKISIPSLLVLQAVLLTVLASLTMRFTKRSLGPWIAGLLGLLVMLAPPVQHLLLLVMSDLFLSVACLLAAIAMACFVERPGKWSALGFGFAAAAAILIKGSGLMLALVPPLVILLASRWKLILKPALWLAPVPVVLLAFPWQLFSFKFTKEGMSGLTVGQHFQNAFGYYWDAAMQNVGLPVLLLLGVLLCWALFRWICQGSLPALEASLWALLLAGLVLVFTVPAGMSPRYLVPLIVPAFSVVVLGLVQLGASVGVGSQLSGAVAALLLAVSLGLTGQAVPVTKQAHGFSAAVKAMEATPRTADGKGKEAWLVCSDARGEGAVIAAAAFDPEVRSLRKTLRVLRGTKELASMDWLGRDYAPAFASEPELLAHLQKQSVMCVVLDESIPAEGRMPYHAQLQAALDGADSGFRLQETVPADRGKSSGNLLIYIRAR